MRMDQREEMTAYHVVNTYSYENSGKSWWTSEKSIRLLR